jgi:deoxyhypusine synthase
MAQELPAELAEAVLVQSEPIDAPTVKGFDFNTSADANAVLETYIRTGFQAQNYGRAVEEINKMLDWSLATEPTAEDEDEEWKDAAKRETVRCKIWLSFTSNMISAGVRETIRFVMQHSMVQVMMTTCGGIEEDIIKCMSETYVGDFELDGKSLRKKGINRIGNLLAPNENYCKFEDWIHPILNAMHDEQEKDGVIWSPSKMIHRFGKEIGDESSVCYWAYKNNIPVFCPAITDGSIGDMIYFHTYKRPGFIVDIAQDIRLVNDEALRARKTGVIVLGGGLVKHHVMNANLMRNGADFCVYVNTGQEFDGSDSGARPDEAKSWGKIRVHAQPVKIYADATLVFPLLVAQTFARKFHAGAWTAERVKTAVFNKAYAPSEHDAERKRLQEC